MVLVYRRSEGPKCQRRLAAEMSVATGRTEICTSHKQQKDAELSASFYYTAKSPRFTLGDQCYTGGV